MRQTKLSKSWKKRPRAVRKQRPQSSSSSDDEGATGSAPTIKSIALPRKTQNPITSDEEESPKRPTRVHTSPLKKVDSDNEADSHSLSDPLTSEEDSTVIPNAKKRARKHVVLSDDDSQRKPKKRLTRGVRPPTPEPENLIDELDTDVVIEPRMRERSKVSAYQKNLEKLKRKKLGLKPSQDTEQVSEDDESQDVSDTSPVPFPGAKPSSSFFGSDEEEDEATDESAFIVEDDVSQVILPAKFSRDRHRSLEENFKILCQLLVHVSLQPPDQREGYMQQRLNDDYFLIARDDIHNKMSGILTQSITSQIWKKSFQDPLKTYPIFNVDQLVTAVPYCDACRLTRRISTRHGVLSGEPYRLLGFEPIVQHDSDSSASESDGSCQPKEFDMGRFCARRAELFHSFCHWEYHLFHALDVEVHAIRHPTNFVKVSSARSIRPPEDLTDGDAIMEWLDDREIIERQFHLLKRLMKSGQTLDKAEDDGN